MKGIKLIIVLLTQLWVGEFYAQLSINISPTLCPGSISNVSVSTGTFSAIQYSWTVSPAGPVFSAPSASITDITFNSPGPYTVSVDVLTGTGILTATTNVNVTSFNSLPTLTIFPAATALCPGYTTTLTGFGALTYTWISNTFTGSIVQQSIVVSAGSYTLMGWQGSNCIDTLMSISINSLNPANALPITISASQPTTCITSNFPKFSKPITLVPTGAGTYSWAPSVPPPIIVPPNPGITVRPTTSTCYTVIGSTAVCSNTAVYCVTVVPQFSVNILPSSITMCEGDTMLLSIGNVGSSTNGPSSAWTYSWAESAFNTTATISSYFTSSVKIFPVSSTSYTAELRDSKECTSSPEVATVTVNKCTGLYDATPEAQLFVFPNPVQSELKFQTSFSGSAWFYLSDILGNIIRENSLELFSQKVYTIPVSDLPSGVYYLKVVVSTQQILVKKIIKH